MVAGIDDAGFALSILPVVIGVINWYSNQISSHDVLLLAESLENNRWIFLNSVECMLRSVVSPAELQTLLSDFKGAAWKEQNLSTRLSDHLGADADRILGIIGDIHQTVAKLAQKLPMPSNSPKDRKSILDRAKLIIKAFVHGGRRKASLDRLKIRIEEFRTLTKDSVELASPRKTSPEPDALRNLGDIHKCADGLHDALQAGWTCMCDKGHPANIQLEVWSQTNDQGTDNVSFKFSLLFASDAEHAQSDHWITAEITLASTGSAGIRPSPQISAVMSRANNIGSIPSPISLPSSPNSTPTTSPSNQQPPENLCDAFQSPNSTQRTGRRRFSLSDSSGQTYDLKPSPVLAATSTMSSIKLGQVFRNRSMLTNKERVLLGLMLAWGVLQISPTRWLEGTWTRDNVLLVRDGTNHPLPYISHAFQSKRRNSTSSTLTPTTSNHGGKWIRNASLFALGIFLLELYYNSSIEDLAMDDEKGRGGEATAVLTAMRLSHDIQDEMGLQYAQAVRACLRADVDTDADGKPLDSEKFGKSIMKDIINPLKGVAASFGTPVTA